MEKCHYCHKPAQAVIAGCGSPPEYFCGSEALEPPFCKTARYAPKTIEQAAAKLIEECAEVQKSLCKMLRFGFDVENPREERPEIDCFHEEMEDIIAAYAKLKEFLNDLTHG